MGYFTWTDARKEKPKKNTYGFYYVKDIIPYGGYAGVVCPDDSVIKEPYYDGYGMFGGYDIFELVADWNRDYIAEIYKYVTPDEFGFKYRDIAIAYSIKNEELLRKAIDDFKKKKNSEFWDNEIEKEWKRTIGITVAYLKDENGNHICPYPIKIIKVKRKKYKYKDLHASYECQ